MLTAIFFMLNSVKWIFLGDKMYRIKKCKGGDNETNH